MEVHNIERRRTLCSFIDDKEEFEIESPPRLSYKSHKILSSQNDQFSPARSSTQIPISYSIMPPPASPGSPWKLSPLQTPSPSILYHCIASLRHQEGTIHSIAVSRGIVYTGSDSSRIRVWQQPECMEKGHLKASCGDVRAIIAYGNLLFTSHKDYKVRMWNVTISTSDSFCSTKVVTLPKKNSMFMFTRGSNQQHRDLLSCMAYYHSEGLLYTGSWDRMIKVWRVSDNRMVDSFLSHEDHVNCIQVNQEDGCVFSCSSDGSVKIWRRVYGHSHTLTMTLKFQLSPVNTIALSTSLSSSFLYSGSSDGMINFWEKEKTSGSFNHGGFLQGHRFAVLCLVVIEKLIFSGSEDTTIRVWRREEGSCFHECLAVLDGHRGPVKCLAASLEIDRALVKGFLVFSAGLDQTFKVWRIKVLPEDDKGMGLLEREDSEDGDVKMKAMSMGYEISPVLSPSWVERKLQASHSFQ